MVGLEFGRVSRVVVHGHFRVGGTLGEEFAADEIRAGQDEFRFVPERLTAAIIDAGKAGLGVTGFGCVAAIIGHGEREVELATGSCWLGDA